MVVWKGEVEREHGEKAFNLDNTDLDTPNFFVVTAEEVKDIFQSRDSQEILNKPVEIDDIKEAYDDVGMSTEVRNASSRARSLVGGQRNNTRVAIRVSDGSDADFELDVGKGELEDALKRVVASYFEEGGESYPNVLIQKMIEADYTGALIKGERDYIEVVEGLGISLEDGKTVPTMYSIGEEAEVRVPDQQLKVTRNPMTGGYRERKIEPERPFDRSEILELSEKSENSIKFVYKRGSFFVVDRFEAERYSEGLDYVRVSPGEINGVFGREVDLSDQTRPPEEYDKALVARKGGYTSNDAKRARKAGKPAIFSYTDAEEGMSLGQEESSISTFEESSSEASATEVSSISDLETSFGPDQSYLKSYADVFGFESGSAVLDGRMLDTEVLPEALDYLSGDVAVLLDTKDSEVLEAVVRNDFSLGVARDRIEEFEEALEVAERRFILDRLRELE
jgi:hypothetical protein